MYLLCTYTGLFTRFHAFQSAPVAAVSAIFVTRGMCKSSLPHQSKASKAKRVLWEAAESVGMDLQLRASFRHDGRERVLTIHRLGLSHALKLVLPLVK